MTQPTAHTDELAQQALDGMRALILAARAVSNSCPRDINEDTAPGNVSVPIAAIVKLRRALEVFR